MPFGALASEVQHYYYEQFINVTIAQAIAQGGSLNVNAGSLTMPWAGDVIMDGWVQMYYDTGATILSTSLASATSIAATSFWPGTKTETSPSGGYLVVPCFGRWAGLAKGTFFQNVVKITVGAVNGRAVASSFIGSLRAQAA